MPYRCFWGYIPESDKWNLRIGYTSVVEVEVDYSPQIVTKVDMAFPCREKLKSLNFGVAENSDNETSQEDTYVRFGITGGCLPLNGYTDNIEFGYDITSLANTINSFGSTTSKPSVKVSRAERTRPGTARDGSRCLNILER